MKTILAAGLAVGAFLFAGNPAMAHDDGTDIPGQLVLVTNPGVTLDDVRAAHPGLSLTPLRLYTPARIHLLGIPLGQEAAYELELAADATRVRVAERNRTVASAEEGTTQSLFLRSTRGEYEEQQAFVEINREAATMGRRPANVVAVLDTGVAPHPDLIGRLAPGGYNFITDSPVVDESGCAPGTPLLGHGTFIAGVIAAVDPDARVLPVTVLGCGGVGNAFAVACGIYHAMDQGAGVINMSFATVVASNLVERAVEDAEAAGVICVGSMGNSARNTDNTRIYPAEFDQVMGIGGLVRSSTGNWVKASFSDWERSSDLAAPAVNITSTWFDGAQYTYATCSGNSYATALVAGVASMVRAKFGPRGILWTESRFCGSAETVFIGVPFGLGCHHRDDGFASLLDARRAVCPADYNADQAVDFFDYLDLVADISDENPRADFDRSGTIDFFDYLDFVRVFDEGC
jgi:subtilisin family serine protease